MLPTNRARAEVPLAAIKLPGAGEATTVSGGVPESEQGIWRQEVAGHDPDGLGNVRSEERQPVYAEAAAFLKRQL